VTIVPAAELHTFVPSALYRTLPKSPNKWVIDKLVPVGGLVNVFGKPKTGKSFLALGMAQAIVNGDLDWEGYRIDTQGSVAYLQIDTPREEWSDRIGRLTLSPTEGRELWIADMWQVPQFPFDILDPAQTGLKWLKDQMASIQPVLTIIDTLREAHGADENDSTAMRNVLTNLVAACRPSAIMLLSHARKDTILTSNGDDDLMDQNRGSSYIPGRMDVIIKLTQKRMTFKGRATGQLTENIIQDPATGLIQIQPSTDDAKTTALIHQIMAQLGPTASQNAVARELAAALGVSKATADRRLKALMVRA
jgi:RecA-family ATPase